MPDMGRRRASSGGYNPLADQKIEGTSPDTWVCTAEHGAKFYSSESVDDVPAKEVKLGAIVDATRHGNWLREKSSGLYAVFGDKDGNRFFKNQRLLLLERMALDQPQTDKIMERKVSSGSQSVDSTEASTPPSKGRRASFRWVDSEGIAQRLEGTEKMVMELNVQPEVWICIADRYVPYYNNKSFGDTVPGKECKVGGKLNAIKDGDWIRVMDVKTTYDTAGIGRRSFKAVTKFNIEDTGHFVPLVDKSGKALFKSQKVALWEESAQAAGGLKQANSAGKKDDGCVAM